MKLPKLVGSGPIEARLLTTPTTIHTADGSTVTVRRHGIGYDLETKNAKGETISTVSMNRADVSRLFGELDSMLWSDAA
ncbi:hypothetical protein [Streptomyces sp. NBC_00239]|uniref:hypothetical protein n=1 Tax=Streptomyces sp. NBC_00239 TaxID=2903640 RepID=UPI002E2DCADA|nr:hypothetical protein [Streptomyces sp. NBC_00239]